jgi:iron complex outermembrane recepter protein
MSNSKYLLGGGAAISLFLVSVGMTEAQTPISPESSAPNLVNTHPTPSVTSGDEIGEIVVFARKKAVGENAQSVPIAISGFSADTLQEAHAEDITELGRLAPNVQTDTVGTTPGLVNFTIRGVGLNGSIRSVDPAVNVVVDGMTLGYTVGAAVDTFDLDSVEILRGPQGVLFGRNATGGALVLRTALPSDTFHVRERVAIGNFNRAELQSVVEGPLIGDTVLAKVSVSEKYNQGGIKNTNDGTFTPSIANPTGAPLEHSTGNIPKTQEVVVKPTFLFKLGETDQLTLFTQYQNYHDGGTAPINFVPPPAIGGPVALQTVYGFNPTTSEFTANTANPGYSNIEAEHAIGQLDNKIGAGSITTIAAVRYITFDSTIDLLGSPFVLTYLPDNRELNRQISLESRYNISLTDRLNILAGIYGFADRTSVTEDRITSGGNVTPLALAFIRTKWNQEDETGAAFTNVDYKLLEQLTLSVGARYGWERKQMNISPLHKCVSASFQNCPLAFVEGDKHWTDVSPRFALAYQATADILAYASWTKGFRSGNYNSRATTPQAALAPANPESVRSSELGLKSEFLEHKLRLNIAGFYEDYKDIQEVLTANVSGPVTQFLLNAASAKVKGVELETTWLPVRGLKLQGTLGYTNAHYAQFTASLPAGIVGTSLQFPRVPEWTYAAGGDYSFSISPLAGVFTLHTDYSWRSGVFTDLTNTAALYQRGYGLVDADANYKTGRWRFSLFGKNLQNTLYFENAAKSFSYVEFLGSPRTYGVQVNYEL